MPSQEKDLDGLLRELSEMDEEEGGRQGDAGEEHAHDIDDISGMTEAEIARLLSANAESGRQSRGGTSGDGNQGEVPDPEEDSDDGNLQEIRELLQKSDRNETIDVRPEDPPQGMGPADRLFEDIEAGRTDVATNKKKQKALDKKRMKEERAAAKKAAKEAAKAEKAARRGIKGGQKEEGPENAPSQEEGQEKIEEFDMLLDKDLLDSIVSGAGRVEHESRGGTKAAAVEPEEPDEAEEELEPEVLTLDLEEAAAVIPEVSDAEREGQEDKEKGKKGLFSKVVNLLMEEEDEKPEKENENIQISDENQEIIKALDGEKAGKGKTANTKKKKAKAAKKKKDTKAKKPKSKPKKPPKPKKEKEKEPYIPGRRLTFKKVLPVLLLGLTVGAVTFLFVNLTVDFTGKQEAKKAYDAGDYQGCYLNLYGKKLNEKETVMYGKSESILRMRLWYQEYQTMAENGTEAEALDCLIQIINDYPKLYEYALQWNAVPEIYEVYSELLNILNGTYGLTEAQAKEIAALKSDIEYTKAVYAVTEGKGYDFSGVQDTIEPELPDTPESDFQPEGGETEDGQPDGGQPDELPEESEMGNGNFVDNQG